VLLEPDLLSTMSGENDAVIQDFGCFMLKLQKCCDPRTLVAETVKLQHVSAKLLD